MHIRWKNILNNQSSRMRMKEHKHIYDCTEEYLEQPSKEDEAGNCMLNMCNRVLQHLSSSASCNDKAVTRLASRSG